MDLSYNELTDRALVHLSPLRTLAELDLSARSITRKGLVALAPLKRLRYLRVAHTKIKESDARAVQESLPNVRIMTTWADLPPVSGRE